MAERLSRFASLAALALWMGGFTFYALIVIPTGTRLVGSVEQGLVTQQVTQWMNLLGALTLALLLPGIRHSRWLALSWLVMASALIVLCWLHPRLDSLIDRSLRAVSDENRFYRWHQVYLATVTIQWAAALVHLWGVANPSLRSPVAAPAHAQTTAIP